MILSEPENFEEIYSQKNNKIKKIRTAKKKIFKKSMSEMEQAKYENNFYQLFSTEIEELYVNTVSDLTGPKEV